MSRKFSDYFFLIFPFLMLFPFPNVIAWAVALIAVILLNIKIPTISWILQIITMTLMILFIMLTMGFGNLFAYIYLFVYVVFLISTMTRRKMEKQRMAAAPLDAMDYKEVEEDESKEDKE